MEQLKCKECEKVIEGYTENHVEHLMQQHMLVHQRSKTKKKKEKQEDYFK